MEYFKEFNDFDIALALYHWLQHNWDGQTDPKYEAFCILTAPGMYKPSPADQEHDAMDTNDAAIVYGLLTDSNYKKALAQVINHEPGNDEI
jgi:hypothetical protein